MDHVDVEDGRRDGLEFGAWAGWGMGAAAYMEQDDGVSTDHFEVSQLG